MQGLESGGPLTDHLSYTVCIYAGSDPSQRNVSYEMPQFAATFVPGGHDDFQMPEMYAPLPQR